jgi:hypothetical protein
MNTTARKLVINIFALLFILICGAVVFHQISEFEFEKAATYASKHKVFSFDCEEITYLEINQYALSIRAERYLSQGQNHWQITSPLLMMADQEILNRLHQTACQISNQRIIQAGDSQTDYGLGLSTISLTVGTRTKRETIKFGDLNPYNRTVYVHRTDADTYGLIRQDLLLMVQRPMYYFREKMVLPLASEQISDVKIFEGLSLVLQVKREENQYHILKPGNYAADFNAMNNYLGKILSMRALSYVSHEKKYDHNAIVHSAERIFVFTMADNKVITLWLYRKGNEVHAASSLREAVAVVSRDQLSRSEVNLNALRDTKLLQCDRQSITKIMVNDHHSFTLSSNEKVKNGHVIRHWHAGDRKYEAIRQERVFSLLYRIATLNASKFIKESDITPEDLNRYSLAEEKEAIILQSGDDPGKNCTLLFGSYTDDGTGRYVLTGPKQAIAEVLTADLDRIHLKPEYYRVKFTGNSPK